MPPVAAHSDENAAGSAVGSRRGDEADTHGIGFHRLTSAATQAIFRATSHATAGHPQG